jgi:SAM-dependent methyltransferase
LSTNVIVIAKIGVDLSRVGGGRQRVGLREQRLVFGEVADEYDDVRVGYPDALVDAVLEYCGAVPDTMVEIGAGTGKATAAFVTRVPSVTCVEPDPSMASVLRRRLGSAVTVVLSGFEDWQPPSGGVPLLTCAQAWHWIDPDRRLTLAYRALAPRGVLALFGHSYGFADPELEGEINDVYRRLAPELAEPPLMHEVAVPEPHASALFTDPWSGTFDATVRYPTDRYLTLLRTFSNHRMLPGERRAALHAGLAGVIDARGGALDMSLTTGLVLARRAA